MAYSTLTSVSNGDIGASAWAQQVRANGEASAPGVVTTKGDLVAATGANAVARVAAGANDSIIVYDSTQSAGIATQIVPACRVYNNAALDPDTNSWTFDSGGSTALTFNSERFDTDGMHSTASNTSRLTVPANGAGIYGIGACIKLDTSDIGNDDSVVGARIILNGSTVIAEDFRVTYREDDRDLSICLHTVYSLSVADYIEVQVYITEDIAILSDGNNSPEFWAIWQRRQ